MRLSSLLSGTILVALGAYAYVRSVDIMEIIAGSSGISNAMLTILGTDGSSILLTTQAVGVSTLLVGIIVVVYGTVWPERNKPVKDVQEVKMEFTINHKTPGSPKNDSYPHTISNESNNPYTHTISNESNDPYAHTIRRTEMRDHEIR